MRGLMLRRKSFIPSNKNECGREVGKTKGLSWISHRPDFDLQSKLSICHAGQSI